MSVSNKVTKLKSIRCLEGHDTSFVRTQKIPTNKVQIERT